MSRSKQSERQQMIQSSEDELIIAMISLGELLGVLTD